ncbi:CUB and zona pellucida-like domain-containing protein 1 isoform X2 [Pomacea canaliculata]|uniref:CUB and zona pellucida-like domain-containing protein 1 isoform X2 n=1 Tax=Pomacea canaliculata TaxID=400727 RepID=UPI000D73D359|nr:CUB and zona pellucida-like domain-containing protein 1 isoform X2 [Pomacea canaliculata]
MITETKSSKLSTCIPLTNTSKLVFQIMVRVGGRNSANVLPSTAHASFYLLTSSRLSLPVLLFFCCIMKGASGYECGGFVLLKNLEDTRTITTPDYPTNYPNFTRCIWLVETSRNHLVSITFTLDVEKHLGFCTDTLQFRDGGQDSEIIKEFCVSVSSYTVRSTGPWMYIAFKSKGPRTFTGFTGQVTSEVAESSGANISQPYSACLSFQLTCSNKLCVSMSYRCDGYYDCGCGKGCDEDGCGSLNLDRDTVVLSGVCIGAVTFVLVAVLGVQLEMKRDWASLNKQLRRIYRTPTLTSNFGKLDRLSMPAFLRSRMSTRTETTPSSRDVTWHRSH